MQLTPALKEAAKATRTTTTPALERRRRWQPPAVNRLSVVDSTLAKGATGLDVDMEAS